MRALAVRQRVARAAVLAASVALVAACGTTTSPGPTGKGALGAAAGFAPGMLLVSDGTAVVRVGGRTVTFPTTVTDAAWSPDGSRIAFVDGDGNIATARSDAGGLRVLTKQLAGAARSRPAWSGGRILFAEAVGGKTTLRAVSANGPGLGGAAAESAAFLGILEDGDNDREQPAQNVSASSSAASGGNQLAFQRGADVWISDLNQREPIQSKLVTGAEPARSPDGTRVAYVDGSGQVEALDAHTGGAKPTQLTFGVTAPTHLTWTSDGARVAFATKTDIESVSATVAAGATANPTTVLAATTGVPTFLPLSRDQVVRIAGTDPVDLSIAASQASWPTQQEFRFVQTRGVASAAILTGASNLPTILAGAQMVDDGPILFTSGSTLDSRTKAELIRIFGQADQPDIAPTATILGGTDVVSAAAQSAVKALGYLTTRTTAKDPAAMAAAAAGRPGDASAVLVVDAADTAAYLAAISAFGQSSAQTVLLTNGASVPDGAKAFLNGISKTVPVYAVGANAKAALATSWAGKPALTVTPLVGATSAATAALVLNSFSPGASRVVIVDASATTDVIAAIGLARRYGAPIFALDPRAALDESAKSWLDASSGSVDSVMIVDPRGVIGADLEHVLGALTAGPLGVSTANNPKVAAVQ